MNSNNFLSRKRSNEKINDELFLSNNKTFQSFDVEFTDSVELRLKKRMIFVNNCFVIEDDMYLYQVFKYGTEEWYILNDREVLKLDIIDMKNFTHFNGDKTKVIRFSNRYDYKFIMCNDNITNNTLLQTGCKIYESLIDETLNNLFYESYKTHLSEKKAIPIKTINISNMKIENVMDCDIKTLEDNFTPTQVFIVRAIVIFFS